MYCVAACSVCMERTVRRRFNCYIFIPSDLQQLNGLNLSARELSLSLSLCLHFNGHFPGEPRLAGVYWSKGWWRWRRQLDYWSYKSCKAPVKSSPSTNQHPVFLPAGCPSCRPTKTVKAMKGIILHSMDLLIPSSPRGLPILSLTTNTSWLPWGRVAMPHISPLMPVHQKSIHNIQLDNTVKFDFPFPGILVPGMGISHCYPTE